MTMLYISYFHTDLLTPTLALTLLCIYFLGQRLLSANKRTAVMWLLTAKIRFVAPGILTSLIMFSPDEALLPQGEQHQYVEAMI